MTTKTAEQLFAELDTINAELAALDPTAKTYEANVLALSTRERTVNSAIRNHPEAGPRRAPIGRDRGSMGNTRSRHTTSTDRAMKAWFLSHAGVAVANDDLACLSQMGFSPNGTELRLPLNSHGPVVGRDALLAIRNVPMNASQGYGDPTKGGFLVGESVVGDVELAKLAYSPLQQICTTIRTETGENLAYPICNDTGSVATILGEGNQASETPVTVGRVNLHSYQYTTGMIRVPLALATDSVPSFINFITNVIGERFGRGMGAHFTTGTGAGQPYGVVTASTLGATSASSTALTSDDLLDLQYSLDPSYRMDDGSTGWMMHSDTLKVVAKLRDGESRPLYALDHVSGRPLLNGWPVFVNNQMSSSITSGEKCVLFGAFRFYLVREVGSMQIMILKERFADYAELGVIGLARADANLLDSGTSPIKHLVQA